MPFIYDTTTTYSIDNMVEQSPHFKIKKIRYKSQLLALTSFLTKGENTTASDIRTNFYL